MTRPVFDPQALPVASLAGESAVAPERLSASWLRRHFAEPPSWTPEHADVQGAWAAAATTPASVLLPIVLRESALTMLFTQRSQHLTDHSGQVSFPGGRREHDDASAVITALRETEEEVGLDRRHVEVLGKLPEYLTGTGYCVTPVVALVAPPFDLHPDPREVAEIFEVPLAFLMDGAHHQRRTAQLPDGGARTFYTMPYDRFFIWGATAGMLRNLFHFLRA